MGLAAAQKDLIEQFRANLEDGLAGDPRFEAPQRHDREDGSTLATRWTTAANPRAWFEVAVRPFIPQVRVGILTDDRWKSEDWEEKIQESGDTMSEFVEFGFEEAGLVWPAPTVEHYREEAKYFYFATALPLNGLEHLADASTLQKVRQMLAGYYEAFGRYLK